ncbi:MAG: 4-hydroxythreonine-4-phosphate dehydrogenase PdxA [Desulfuromonadales bacterium]|nr:4-hydroxythreonine-4-phosphate dehydrogenase PdxA [Desulfuromonadales bacterium]MBN2793332.1 4-hydroxythreonine-4-phosphate dehydrogenase PdxA [Desulfuromonadales bacterium]
MRPLLITMGDPTGIGPELILQALMDNLYDQLRHPLRVIGDIGVLARAAGSLGVQPLIHRQDESLATISLRGQSLSVISCSQLDGASLQSGQPDSACGKAMARYVEFAIAECRTEKAAGIVTCPINKAAINAAGFHFPGHTELLAERCGVDKVVMMLAGERLKVCLVTTHLPLRDIAAGLTQREIIETVRITDRALREHFAIRHPRLAVLALNPHAGEDGLFGDEEQQVITPAIHAVQAQGISASGPHSADTLFHFAAQGHYDAVICMYHDQGLIPLKLLHFDDAINITLGLPIVRTSVDHGTAYDLVGTGQANTASLVAALKMADRMASSRESLSSRNSH